MRASATIRSHQMRAPEFWRRNGPLATALSPLSLAWRVGAGLRRLRARPLDHPIPVICVGNVTVGGAGKTPTVLALLEHFKARGIVAHAVSRGYGGRLEGPLAVSTNDHSATDVGDEPLLLARAAPTWVARDRGAGIAAAAAAGAQLAILDDGLQNPNLRPDLSFLVLDGGYGIGNGRCLPAGPLREPLESALERSDALIVIGPDRSGLASQVGKPVLRAALEPLGAPPPEPLLAFAGIGRPEKFFDSLRAAGGQLVGCRGFADHAAFSESQLQDLAAQADAKDALLITTEKDALRLPEPWRRRIAVFPVALSWREPALLDALLAPLLKRLAT